MFIMSNMNLLFWNIRGLGKGEKCICIRNLISKNRVSLVGLVETKHRHSFGRRVKRMWGSDVYDWCESPASETHSGGIVVLWDPNKGLPKVYWGKMGSVGRMHD